MDAVAVSGTSTHISSVTNITNLDNIGLQLNYTGTMAGTFLVECSPDNIIYDSLTFNPVITQPSGASGHYLISLNQVPWQFVRVSYTNVSGSGVINVTITGKDLN